AKKKAAARLTMIVVRSRVAKIGSRLRNDPPNPARTTLRRALRRSPVRRRIASLSVPPARSPATPAKKTADAKSADRVRLSVYSWRKNDGSQLRYSQSVQP